MCWFLASAVKIENFWPHMSIAYKVQVRQLPGALAVECIGECGWASLSRPLQTSHVTSATVKIIAPLQFPNRQEKATS